MTSDLSRKPYSGTKTTLVIAIDVGTTFSGASYTFLVPNQIPRIYCVTNFEGQENESSRTKVQTVLHYDAASRLVACGSQPINEDDEADGDLIRVEWFKLLMRPGSRERGSLVGAPAIHLPRGLQVIDVLGHFLRYMTNCVRDYIAKTHSNGWALWSSTINEATFILTHPNGWAGYQQGQIRQAAINGGLINDTDEDHQRLEFLTEGEASIYWCVDMELVRGSLQKGNHIVVADAGGGTIDVSSFQVESIDPLQLRETNVAQCRVAGSVFVSIAFEKLVRERLKGSEWDSNDRIERLVEEFDKTGKCLFRDRSETTWLRFGSVRESDPARGIRRGKLGIDGSSIASTFENSCSEAAAAIRNQLTGKTNVTAFLVGGFAASPWLYEELKRRLRGSVTELYRADGQTAKAVAHGALVHYLNRSVTMRVAKETYGIKVKFRHDERKASHQGRRTYICPISEIKYVHDRGFATLVTKGEQINVDAEYRTGLCASLEVREDVTRTIRVQKYTGKVKGIDFVEMDSDDRFIEVCTFTTTIPATALRRMLTPTGKIYWAAKCELVISLGTTELVCWAESGDTVSTRRYECVRSTGLGLILRCQPGVDYVGRRIEACKIGKANLKPPLSHEELWPTS